MTRQKITVFVTAGLWFAVCSLITNMLIVSPDRPVSSLLVGAVVAGLLFGAGMCFVTRGHPVRCPECGATWSVYRLPRNGTQFMWGGRTCTGCGQSFDRFGKRLSEA